MRLFVLLSILGLSGCAAGSYCTDAQKYQAAKSVPPLSGAEGLQLTESPSALRIPPPPQYPVAFGEMYQADTDEMVRCLDTPPPMVLPPSLPQPAEEKPKS